ncbi:MAG TPA: hypothetical protein VL981_07765 [Candidatus Methylacidiphilales bacterium]|nr:hypothetical protein [Candidatus Methylacidiphilales bacterium]
MPQTIHKTSHDQIIGGTFSIRENADKAVEAFLEMGVSPNDIQTIVQLNEKQAKSAYSDMLSERGFAESQAEYYDKAIRAGKILVVVYDVTNAADIIDVFDRFNAEYNPNGSRNLRDDVAGMTAGAVVGAVTGGAAGAALGGPVGGVAGAAAGAVIGGGTGAAAGKAAEHKK